MNCTVYLRATHQSHWYTIQNVVPAENGSEVHADRMNVLFRTVPFRVKYHAAINYRSPSDAIDDLETKMMEYIADGAQLGLLIDCVQLQVVVYRPSAAPERFDNPRSISGDPVLPGFTLDLQKIW